MVNFSYFFRGWKYRLVSNIFSSGFPYLTIFPSSPLLALIFPYLVLLYRSVFFIFVPVFQMIFSLEVHFLVPFLLMIFLYAFTAHMSIFVVM